MDTNKNKWKRKKIHTEKAEARRKTRRTANERGEEFSVFRFQLRGKAQSKRTHMDEQDGHGLEKNEEKRTANER